MSQKRIKLEGQAVYLPEFLGVENLKSGKKFACSYYVEGKRKRKYFDFDLAGLKEAKVFASTVTNERKKFGADFGNISDDERRAIELYREYKKQCIDNRIKPLSMMEVVNQAVEAIQIKTPTIKEMCKRYIDHLLQQSGGKATHNISTTTCIFNVIIASFGERQMHNLTHDEVMNFITNLKKQDGEAVSELTKNHYIATLKKIYNLAITLNLITEGQNVVKNIERIKATRKEADVMSVEDTVKVFTYLKSKKSLHKYIPIIAIGFFGGLRVAERCRVQGKDIFIGGRNEIFLSEEITKTNQARYVNMSQNLIEWLNFAQENGVVIGENDYLIGGATEENRIDAFRRLLIMITKGAGVEFKKNVIRHSAASYMSALHGLTETAIQLGHSETILKKHYRRAMTKDDAKAYFDITPELQVS